MKNSSDQTILLADIDSIIEAYKKDIDVTLIRENLGLTVNQRIERLMELQRFADELQQAGRKARQKR